MPTTRTNLRALTLACTVATAALLGTAGTVEANVIYSFTPAAITVLDPDRTPSGYSTPSFGAGFSFEVADAAIERGSFTIKASAGYGSTSLRGDAADFVGFKGPEATITSGDAGYGFGTLDMTLSFDTFGNVLAGTLKHISWNEQLTFNMADNFVSGRWDSEYPACWHGCAETGALMIRNVPEPATLALLGVGLLGLVVTRRRAATA